MTSTAQKRILNRTRMLAWLEELGKSQDPSGITISLKHDVSPEDIQRHVRQVSARPDIVEQCTYHAGKTTSGTVIIWSEKHKYLVHPPFPIATTCITPGIDVSVLHELLSYDYLIGVVLVRLGAYAVGIAKGEKLLSSKIGTGNIHSRHHKGGSSANRFRRHREKQTEYFMTRLCGHAREHLEPHLREMDYMVYGGAWTTVEILKKQCEFIARIKTPELPPLLDIPDPRLPVLEKAMTRIWSSTVYEWMSAEEPT